MQKDAAELAALDAKIKTLLPTQYQHCYASVSPNSMGSAKVKYGGDGRVAWNQIWTSFCDLALAGGPPHRGKLLEPVSESEVAADPESYARVISEIHRAIRMTTGLPVAPGYMPGWIGARCASPAEAAWLQFAITAENVSARRKQAILYLPAGPDFRIEKEIKNVVVSLAKSYHYWDGHLTADQQTLTGESAWEPATASEATADWPSYKAAMNELEPALRATGLKTFPRRYVGWIGLQTASDAEAVWLLRAILVEQVLARREGNILFLPVSAVPNPDRAERTLRALHQALRLWKAFSSGVQPEESDAVSDKLVLSSA